MNFGGFDLTFPRVRLTGGERTIQELTQPDEQSVRYGLDVESLQSPYLDLEKRLPDAVPSKLRERIIVARQLGTYAFFRYEFHAVSLFWSVSCIEMALKFKFEEVHPGQIMLKKKGKKADDLEQTCEVSFMELEEKIIRQGWRIPGIKYFDYSFKAFLTWAFRQALLPEDIEIPVQEIVHSFNNRFLSENQRKNYQAKPATVLIEELPKFRNLIAHPQRFNLVAPPRSPISAYQLLIDIVSRMWSTAPSPDLSP